ncbi:MAG: hypothetical protein U0822_04790 [Anaerolineae bacterium]
MYDEFQELCRTLFQFLEEEYGFRVTEAKGDVFGSYITYRNMATAVMISFEPREGGVFIRLYRLVDGKIPDYPVFIYPDTQLNMFYLDTLLEVRAPSLRVEQDPKEMAKPSLSKLKEVLQQYAALLHLYADDILQGDFKVFEELEKIVKKRAEEIRRQKR